MSDAAAPVPAAEHPISAVSAIVGTFSSPSETFRRLVARPTWWLPLVLLVISTAGVWPIVAGKMDMDRTIRESIEKQAQKSGRSIPAEQLDRQVAGGRKMIPIIFGAALVATVAFFFFAALVLWGAARMMGAEARYAQFLAIWGHAGLPSILGMLLSIPIFLALPDASLTQDGVSQVVKSNVGAFLDPSAAPALRAFASSIDIFTFAVLFLLVVAFRRVPGLSKGAATATPIVLWVVIVIGKVAWRAVMG
ncbi:MAG: YIP1 family protein [Acidobacteriota bacterium]|nr:YIP1 family protein [Acidobacteriota bacterium]